MDGGTGGHGRRRRSQGRLRLTMCPPQGDFDRACRRGAAAAAAAGGRVARRCAALAASSPPPLLPLLLPLSLEAIAAVERGLEAEPLLVDAGHRDGDTLVQPGPRNALLVDRHGAVVAAIQRPFVPVLEGQPRRRLAADFALVPVNDPVHRAHIRPVLARHLLLVVFVVVLVRVFVGIRRAPAVEHRRTIAVRGAGAADAGAGVGRRPG